MGFARFVFGFEKKFERKNGFMAKKSGLLPGFEKKSGLKILRKFHEKLMILGHFGLFLAYFGPFLVIFEG